MTYADWFCSWMRTDLRRKCYLIGYMHLIASLVDTIFHSLIAFIVTSGFKCDADLASLQAVNWTWLEPVLLYLNLGTHGFYLYPLIVNNRHNTYLDYMPVTLERNCYPGMHISLVDVINYLNNVVWIGLVISYIRAIYRKDLESLHLFFQCSIVKLAWQVIYFASQQDYNFAIDTDGYWIMKIMNILIAVVFLIIIHKYMKELQNEIMKLVVDQPPYFDECLITEKSRSEK